MRTIVFFALFFMARVTGQGLAYNSQICSLTGVTGSNAATKTKFKTFIDNLNKDTTIKAQKTRMRTFMTNNVATLKGIVDKSDLDWQIPTAQYYLEARFRIVKYLKDLLTKIKAKLADAKFQEIKKNLWSLDKTHMNDAIAFYEKWKDVSLSSINNTATRSEVAKVISNHESPQIGDLLNDMFDTMAETGFNGCSI